MLLRSLPERLRARLGSTDRGPARPPAVYGSAARLRDQVMPWRGASAPGGRFVHRRGAVPQAPMALAGAPPRPGSPAAGAARTLERDVEVLVRENLERWRKKTLDPQRIAREAETAMVRRLVRERERLGR